MLQLLSKQHLACKRMHSSVRNLSFIVITSGYSYLSVFKRVGSVISWCTGSKYKVAKQKYTKSVHIQLNITSLFILQMTKFFGIHLLHTMHDHYGRFWMDIFNSLNMVEICTHVPDVGLSIADTLVLQTHMRRGRHLKHVF